MFTLLLLFAITPDEAYNSKISELNKKCETILSKALAEEASKEFYEGKASKIQDLYSDYSVFISSGTVPARLSKHYRAKKIEIYNEILAEYAGSPQLARFKDKFTRPTPISEILPTRDQIDSIGHPPLTISQQAKISKILDKMKSYEGKQVVVEFDATDRIFLVGDGSIIKIGFKDFSAHYAAPPQSVIKKLADDNAKITLQTTGRFHIGKEGDGAGDYHFGYGNEFLARFCEKGTFYFIYEYESTLIVNGERITLTPIFKDIPE